jgi:hypothetical protein
MPISTQKNKTGSLIEVSGNFGYNWKYYFQSNLWLKHLHQENNRKIMVES